MEFGAFSRGSQSRAVLRTAAKRSLAICSLTSYFHMKCRTGEPHMRSCVHLLLPPPALTLPPPAGAADPGVLRPPVSERFTAATKEVPQLRRHIVPLLGR